MLEKAGKPAVVIATSEFAALAQAEASALGCAGLPIVVVEHPVSEASPEGVRARAEAAYTEIVQALTAPAPDLERHYSDLAHGAPQSRFRPKPLFSKGQ